MPKDLCLSINLCSSWHLLKSLYFSMVIMSLIQFVVTIYSLPLLRYLHGWAMLQIELIQHAVP